ncbi:DUF4369 domain-containing protein [Alistipes sp. ZOR0009]|uniref:DUF4369 domain-containing protein n=1 Tax=Alistipes sp. ZOR0009 TaxID=1339253 RepID=UPI00064567E7|nr:DUF4369 domain-containing protein [Alistipes sp. ZOR0009]
MKSLGFIFFVVLGFTACKHSNFTIEGEISNAATPPTILVNIMHADGAIRPIDSTLLHDGKFSMLGKVKRTEVAFLQFSNEATFPFILEKGDIKVAINYDKWDEYKITGTPLNDKFDAFHSRYHALWANADSAYVKFVRAEGAGKLPKEELDVLRKEVMIKYGLMLDYSKSYIAENKDNILSVAALWSVHKVLKKEDYKTLSNIISPNLKYSNLLDLMQKQANGKLPN